MARRRHPLRGLLVGASAATLAVAGCSDEPDQAGTWRLVSLERNGQVVLENEPLFMELGDESFSAETPCNTIGGEFGGQLESTAMSCGNEANQQERLMADAFRTQPSTNDDQLVFDTDRLRLVYQRYTEQDVTELFATLGDRSASVDESALPPESATGTVPPDYDALVPVPSPDPGVDLFLGNLEGNVCVVYGTSDAVDKVCRSSRLVEGWATAIGIPKFDDPTFRVVLVPDAFVEVAADRTDLGSYDTNLLYVREDAPTGTHVLTNEAGEQLRVTIPDR